MYKRQLVGNWGATILELCEEHISHPESWVYFNDDGTPFVEVDDPCVDADDPCTDTDDPFDSEARDYAVESKADLYRKAFPNDMKLVGVNAFVRRQDPEKGIERLAKLVQLLDEHYRDYTGDRLVESMSLKARVRRHEKLLAFSSWLRQIGEPLTADDFMPLVEKADQEKLCLLYTSPSPRD